MHESFDVEDHKAVPILKAKLTGYVLLACMSAASGGFLFGRISNCRSRLALSMAPTQFVCSAQTRLQTFTSVGIQDTMEALQEASLSWSPSLESSSQAH